MRKTMTRRMIDRLKELTVDAVVRTFAEAAKVRDTELYENANARNANAQFDVMKACFDELRSRGADAQSELVALVASRDAAVRLATAEWVVDLAPSRAVPILESFSNEKKGLRSLTAEMTLKEWRKRAGMPPDTGIQ